MLPRPRPPNQNSLHRKTSPNLHPTQSHPRRSPRVSPLGTKIHHLSIHKPHPPNPRILPNPPPSQPLHNPHPRILYSQLPLQPYSPLLPPRPGALCLTRPLRPRVRPLHLPLRHSLPGNVPPTPQRRLERTISLQSDAEIRLPHIDVSTKPLPTSRARGFYVRRDERRHRVRRRGTRDPRERG